jgi:Winged helix DNA-binding domain
VPEPLTDDQVRLLRLRANRLLEPSPRASAADVVNAAVGIQAQDQAAAALGIRARSAGLTAADVAQERNEERAIVRTWAMRGTLHWLAARDVRWLITLFGEDFIRKNRHRREQLGLDDDVCECAVRALRDVLADRGPLTRDEITEALAVRDIKLEGQARPHLLYVAAFQGAICCGPDRGVQPTYVLLDDWLRQQGPSPSRDEALAELARRYLGAYAPAAPADFAAWSGLAMPDARAAWQQVANEVVEVSTSRGAMSLLKEHAGRIDEKPEHHSTVRLLGAFDTYPFGYRDRHLITPPEHARRVNAGGGMVRPILIVEGLAVGTWRTKRQRNRLDVTIDSFQKLGTDLVRAIEAEAADIGRFLEIETLLSVRR